MKWTPCRPVNSQMLLPTVVVTCHVSEATLKIIICYVYFALLPFVCEVGDTTDQQNVTLFSVSGITCELTSAQADQSASRCIREMSGNHLRYRNVLFNIGKR